MKKYIITWRQVPPRVPGNPSTPLIYDDCYDSETLSLAVEQWSRKSYLNAEILSVRLVSEPRGSVFVLSEFCF